MKTLFCSIGLISLSLGIGCSEKPVDEKTNLLQEAQDSQPEELSCGVNPYEGKVLPVNPRYEASIREKSMPALVSTADKAYLPSFEKLTKISTAVWIDSIDSISKIKPAIQYAGAATRESGKPSQLTMVVYNLPVRDCNANASNGELGPDDMGRYKKDFIDKIRAEIQAAPEQKFSLILEVDSLPNMVSNMGNPNCALAEDLYKEGIGYAIDQFDLENVSTYLDVAHSGWLGWKSNQEAIALLFKELLSGERLDKIRGFATNVSNYTPLKRINGDRTDDYFSYNDALDELSFVSQLKETFAQHGMKNKGFLIDTSRNGVQRPREDWGYWCNVKGAGLGERPQIAPAAGRNSCVDAYLWIKPPGESDGTANEFADRYDSHCRYGKYGDTDASRGENRAPEAGAWFHDHLLDMVKKANPAL